MSGGNRVTNERGTSEILVLKTRREEQDMLRLRKYIYFFAGAIEELVFVLVKLKTVSDRILHW